MLLLLPSITRDCLVLHIKQRAFAASRDQEHCDRAQLITTGGQSYHTQLTNHYHKGNVHHHQMKDTQNEQMPPGERPHPYGLH